MANTGKTVQQSKGIWEAVDPSPWPNPRPLVSVGKQWLKVVQQRLRTTGAAGSPEHAKNPPDRPGPSARGGPTDPEGSAARAATPGRGAALSRAARHAGSRSPRPPHGARRPSPAAPAPALRAPGAHRSLGPEAPPLPGLRRACPDPEPPLPVPRSAATFRFLRAAPLGARSPAALFTTVSAPSPRRTPAAGTGRCATAAA
ncbi:nematocyst expressed protein 3-like [Sylvia atricapilla]|uniref:nematocyst expressed protein 3-like n=1 Tax=Sylvia atricapilla TaxID=48155 RepID=UPI00339AA141